MAVFYMHPVARTATASPVRLNIGVFWCEVVSTATLCFCGISGSRALATEQVFPARDRLQVSRVNAGPFPTRVVYLKAAWYGAFIKLIRKAVGIDCFSLYLKFPIPSSGDAPAPQPARFGFYDFFEKHLLKRFHRAVIPNAIFPVKGVV